MTEDVSNHDKFRNCLADIVIAELAPAPDPSLERRRKRAAAKSRRSKTKDEGKSELSINVVNLEKAKQVGSSQDEADNSTNNAEGLAEFVEFLADEIFPSLPAALQDLDYAAVRNDETLAAAYTAPIPLSTLESLVEIIPASTLDSLLAYNLISADDQISLQNFLRPLMTAYIAVATTPPSSLAFGDASTRPSACEICARDWIPLTYHHLIPRAVHAKVLKRGWHEEWRLNSVAWLCRACHSMVHRVATNEELARELWSTELLLQREDVQAFAAWIGGVRWKKR